MHPVNYLEKANIKLMPFRLYSLDSGTDHTLTQRHISIQNVSQKILPTHLHTPTSASLSESFNYSKGSYEKLHK